MITLRSFLASILLLAAAAPRANPDLAEGVVSSVRPAPLPVYRPDDLPSCK
jgi:hypothetical protein